MDRFGPKVNMARFWEAGVCINGCGAVSCPWWGGRALSGEGVEGE